MSSLAFALKIVGAAQIREVGTGNWANECSRVHVPPEVHFFQRTDENDCDPNYL